MIKNELITFNITDNAIAELSQQYSGLIAVFGDTKAEKELREAISVIRYYRVQIEHRRKELKADALEYGRKVDAEAKRITDSFLKIEEPLKANKEKIDAERERIKEEKRLIEVKRIETIQNKIFKIKELVFNSTHASIEEAQNMLEVLNHTKISQQEYQEFFQQAIDIHNETVESLQNIIAIKEENILKTKSQELEALRLKEERARIVEEKKALEEEKAVMLQEREKIAKEQYTEKENGLHHGIIGIGCPGTHQPPLEIVGDTCITTDIDSLSEEALTFVSVAKITRADISKIEKCFDDFIKIHQEFSTETGKKLWDCVTSNLKNIFNVLIDDAKNKTNKKFSRCTNFGSLINVTK